MNHILRQCVKSFSHLGENEIKCWNEENSDIYEHEAIRFLVEKKDWAFVSDYVRLRVLYEHGGIYLNTDIQYKLSNIVGSKTLSRWQSKLAERLLS